MEALQGGSISPFTLLNITMLDRKLGQHGDLSASVYNLFDKRYPESLCQEQTCNSQSLKMVESFRCR
jgi:outer membrane receptor for ferrienterochelin and colicin